MKPDEVRLVGQQAHDWLQKEAIRNFLLDDKIAMTFQTLRQYRKAALEVLQPTVPQPKPNLPEEGFGSVYDQQDRIDLEERDK